MPSLMLQARSFLSNALFGLLNPPLSHARHVAQ